jgi:peptide/nickel transport system substrate-binding protein
MKKSMSCAICLALVLLIFWPALAFGKDVVRVTTSEKPVRFFACGPDGSNNADLIILNNIYDPLLTMQADGTLKPCLAKEYKVSPNGLVYTFKLRENVRFHDGSLMTSDDVVATLDLGSKNSVGKALLINYSKAIAIDKYTVEVHLTAPFAGFLNGIASRAALIFSKAYLDKVGVAGYLKAPIGTGPYRLSSVSSDIFKLEAFPEYWAGPAKIKTVEIRIMADPSTQMIALENGDVDFVLSPSIASGSKLNKSKGVVFETGDSAGRVAMLINDNPGYPGNDKNFRKAVQAGINKKDIILGTTEGLATQLDIDMCDSYSGRPTGFNIVKYDVKKAKEYLNASNYKGEPFEIIVQSGTINEPVAQILQAQLMELGINATVKALDTATFTDLWYAGKFGAMIRLTSSSLLDADGFLNTYMVGNYAPTDNNQFPRSKEIYDLGMSARAAQGDARKAIYLKCVNIVTEEAYQIPIFAAVNTVAYRNTLQGIKVHPLNLLFFYDWSYK